MRGRPCALADDDMLEWWRDVKCRDSVCDHQQFVSEKLTETITQLGGVLSTG